MHVYAFLYICILFYMYAFGMVDCVILSVFNKIRPDAVTVHFTLVTVHFFH